MALTPESVKLIRESWSVLARDPDALTIRFYDELFRLAPELRPLFARTDLPAQRRKLAAALDSVVQAADDLAPLIPVLGDLGRRHLRYGARDEHYALVGQALLHAITARLGDDLRPAALAAWASAYALVADVMRAGAASAHRKSA